MRNPPEERKWTTGWIDFEREQAGPGPALDWLPYKNQREARYLVQKAEWEAEEAAALAKGRCPASGQPLILDNPHSDGAREGMMSCEVCDCFGYTPEEVGNGGKP